MVFHQKEGEREQIDGFLQRRQKGMNARKSLGTESGLECGMCAKTNLNWHLYSDNEWPCDELENV